MPRWRLILLREALHNAFGIAFLQEGQTRCVLGAEEDVHIRQNEFDAFLRLGAGPQVPTEVHIEGDDGPCALKRLIISTAVALSSGLRASVMPLVWKQRVSL